MDANNTLKATCTEAKDSTKLPDWEWEVQGINKGYMIHYLTIAKYSENIEISNVYVNKRFHNVYHAVLHTYGLSQEERKELEQRGWLNKFRVDRSRASNDPEYQEFPSCFDPTFCEENPPEPQLDNAEYRKPPKGTLKYNDGEVITYRCKEPSTVLKNIFLKF